MRFAFQPLSAPHLARVKVDGATHLFVRFAAQVPGSDVVAIPPFLEREVALALGEARREGAPIERVILVGTDALLLGSEAPGRDPSRLEGFEGAVEALAGVMLALKGERVPFVWRTRGGLLGAMPAPLSRALMDAGPLATVEIGLPTLDAELCRALEGGRAAPPAERLKLAAAASARGVAVRALIDPLVPMLTDQRAALEPLLAALADAGVHRVGVRYLVLTRERAKALTGRLSRMQRALIQGVFAGQPWLPGDPEAPIAWAQKPHKLLPRQLRERGHERVVDAAAKVGIVVDVLDPATGEERTAAEAERSAPGRRERPRKTRPQLDLFRARR